MGTENVPVPSDQSAYLGEPSALDYTAVMRPKEGHDGPSGANNIEGLRTSTPLLELPAGSDPPGVNGNTLAEDAFFQEANKYTGMIGFTKRTCKAFHRRLDSLYHVQEDPRLVEWEDLRHECRNRLDKITSDGRIEADCEGILSYIKTLLHTDCGPLTGLCWNAHYFEEMFRAAVRHAKQQHHGREKLILSRDSFEAVVSTPNHWYSHALSKAKSKMDEAMHSVRGHNQ
ncbi:hypothetical protein CCMA1212_007459 [Trichoderma ghanense]|uniref:Uncharacterized protein n=1 Tax=Trichoderma ghanense TaxID=65468 RepID=A0ABY2GZ87_9HYPO